MMKKIALLLATGLMCAAIAACGKETDNTQTAGTEITDNTSENNESLPVENNTAGETVPESTGTADREDDRYQVGDIDNFDVSSEVVAAFGSEVKTIVADKDLEALADLAAFPLYIGFTDGGTGVETREDFIALGSDRIFTQELTDAMALADETNLSASRAGFSLTNDGRPNIIFGVVNGRLAIQGINY